MYQQSSEKKQKSASMDIKYGHDALLFGMSFMSGDLEKILTTCSSRTGFSNSRDVALFVKYCSDD